MGDPEIIYPRSDLHSPMYFLISRWIFSENLFRASPYGIGKNSKSLVPTLKEAQTQPDTQTEAQPTQPETQQTNLHSPVQLQSQSQTAQSLTKTQQLHEQPHRFSPSLIWLFFGFIKQFSVEIGLELK